jgi:oxygen-independent coproporphyrinogen-3 oxidase
MASIYLHIPFCKQACFYCDFHFSTSLKNKSALVEALATELMLRKAELKEEVSTIYFGGGTPSLLTREELAFLFQIIYEHFQVSGQAEITLEANPDDLTEEKIKQLAQTPVNRLSIGVQSFFDQDLQLMNRAHRAEEAENSLKMASCYFDNLSLDLIYGIPGMNLDRWQQNIEKALSFDIPHISAYALTVEPKTALQKMIQTGKIAPLEEALAEEHYRLLVSILTDNNYINYEFSNFGKLGYFSQNNTAYWTGKHYMGVGPSAHSFDGTTRRWNIRNNSLYIQSIQAGQVPAEMEVLTLADRYNEYIMTGLRTMFGVSIEQVKTDFGEQYQQYLLEQAAGLIQKGWLEIDQQTLRLTPQGKFLGDGIAAELFWV